MSMTRKTITISGVMDDWIKAQIDAGRYANDSEYVRDLIRRDQERQEAISQARALVDQARGSVAGCKATGLKWPDLRTSDDERGKLAADGA